jgi:hypothetical protein
MRASGEPQRSSTRRCVHRGKRAGTCRPPVILRDGCSNTDGQDVPSVLKSRYRFSGSAVTSSRVVGIACAKAGPFRLWAACIRFWLKAAALYVRGWETLSHRMPDRFGPVRQIAFMAGLASIVIALSSPVDAVSPLLVQAHMTQHLLLMVVGPPLLWMGAPVAAMRGAAIDPPNGYHRDGTAVGPTARSYPCGPEGGLGRVRRRFLGVAWPQPSWRDRAGVIFTPTGYPRRSRMNLNPCYGPRQLCDVAAASVAWRAA